MAADDEMLVYDTESDERTCTNDEESQSYPPGSHPNVLNVVAHAAGVFMS